MKFRLEITLLLPWTALALPPGGALGSVSQVNEFLESGCGQTNFALSVQLVNDPAETALIVKDATGRTALANRPPAVGLHRGDLLKVAGFASVNPNGETWVQPLSFSAYGNESVPEPVDCGLAALDRPENAWLKVRVSAKVFSVTPDEFDESWSIAMLSDGGAMIPAFIATDACNAAGVLPDTTIRLTGWYWRSLSGIRKYAGPAIIHDAATSVEIVAPPPDDPFAAPPLERRFYRNPEEIAFMGPRTVSGRVVAVWGRGLLMVKAADNRIVNVMMIDGAPSPRLGQSGVFAGYPYSDLMRINLMRARFREQEVPAVEDDDTPEKMSAEALLAGKFMTHDDTGSGTYHGRLLRFRGTLRSLPPEESHEQRLYIDCGGRPVPVDVGACREVVSRLQPGSEVEVTGRCLLETDGWRADNVFPRVRGFAIIARTPADVRVTRQASWWTPRRLAHVVGLSLVGLALALLWILALLRLSERRGLELYRSRQARDAEKHAREAAELRVRDRTRLAVELHDTISQTLTGATMQIGTAVQFVGGDDALALRHIDIATRTLDSCREELRNCIWDLRSNTLDEKNLSEAVRRTVQRLVGGATLHIRIDAPRDRLSDNAVHALVNVVRELVTNAVRHGGASIVSISVSLDGDTLAGSVEDDGCGFDSKSRPGVAEGHFGLQGVEERLDELGGELSIESRLGEGTKVSFRIPVQPIAAN